jgi:CRP-like cAMP-binding protein
MADGPLAAIAPEVQAELRGLGVTRRYRRGAFLALEGDRSDHVILVRNGRVKIVNTSNDGRDVLLAVRAAGELVGELNALAGSNAPRAASVVALDDVDAQTIPAAEFLRFVERHSSVSFALLRQLAARLREATSRQADAAGYDILHRVARVLVAEAEHSGRPVDGGGLVVGDGLSQHDLAGLVAASTKSVARSLGILRSRGLIATGRRAIVVNDLDGLRRFAG